MVEVTTNNEVAVWAGCKSSTHLLEPGLTCAKCPVQNRAASARDYATHSVEKAGAFRDATGDVMQMIESGIKLLPGYSIILLPLEAAFIPIKSVGTYAPPASGIVLGRPRPVLSRSA